MAFSRTTKNKFVADLMSLRQKYPYAKRHFTCVSTLGHPKPFILIFNFENNHNGPVNPEAYEAYRILVARARLFGIETPGWKNHD